MQNISNHFLKCTHFTDISLKSFSGSAKVLGPCLAVLEWNSAGVSSLLLEWAEVPALSHPTLHSFLLKIPSFIAVREAYICWSSGLHSGGERYKGDGQHGAAPCQQSPVTDWAVAIDCWSLEQNVRFSHSHYEMGARQLQLQRPLESVSLLVAFKRLWIRT